MKKRIIALVMALAFVVSMSGASFASEKSDDLSGLVDMISGIADSVGAKSDKNEAAGDSSGAVSEIGDFFSGLADSVGQEGGDQEQASDILSGISNLISTITGSVDAETAEDVVDADVVSEAAGTLDGEETPAFDVSLESIAGVSAADPDMEYDTLADWDIMVPVPEGVMAVFSSDGYTLYATDEESIPYVRVNSYGGYTDIDELITDLIDVMENDHADLEVLAGPEYVDADGREFCEIIFSYDVQGYPVTDTRAITMVGGRAYMFTAKEVSELDLYVGNLLETVALGSIFLGEESVDTEPPVEEPPVDEPQEPAEDELYWGMGLEVIDEYDLEGDFVTFDEVGLQLWLPDILTPGTLPEEQPEQDAFLGYYTTEDESAYASVVFQPTDMTLEDYAGMLESLGELIEDIEGYVINGRQFVGYYIPTGDTLCLATIIDGLGLVEFAFSPFSDEEFGAFIEIMGVSIQDAE